MTEQPKRIGQYLLVTLYVLIGIQTWNEQMDFTNAYGIALILSGIGILISLLWGPTKGLYYGLLTFPLAFEFLYYDIIAPRMPLFLIHLNLNTLLFCGFYAIFLWVMYAKKLHYLAWVTFLFGFIHVENQLPQQLFASISYREAGQVEQTPIRNALRELNKHEEAPVYLICLDGYPDLTATAFAKNSRADSLLKANHFHSERHKAKSFQTPISVRYLLTGKLYPQTFTNLNAVAFGNELQISLHNAAPSTYQIYVGSVLVDYQLAKPFFSVFAPVRPNRLLLKPFKRYFGAECYIGSSAAMERYHGELISQIDGKPRQLKFLHFLTFHGFSTDYREFMKDIPIADQLLHRILQQINLNAPHAKVIIFSDHGERFTEGLDPYSSIFYRNF